MSRFVLVHGAWHDGSCWAPLVDELVRRGHTAVAVDLPSDQPGLGALDYAEVVERAVGTEPSVLVGHSLGGLTVPVVAQGPAAPWVTAIVLVAAVLPQPGRSFDDQSRSPASPMADGFGRGQERHEGRTTSWPPDAARAGLYAGVAEESSPDVVDAAVAGLRRQAWTIGREVTPLTSWPAVPTTVVVCRDDRVVHPGRLAERGRSLPGTQVVEVPGGHFPMLTRPAELADVVVAAAGHEKRGHRER